MSASETTPQPNPTDDLEAAIDRILVRYFAPAGYQNGNGVATKILAALRPAGVGEAVAWPEPDVEYEVWSGDEYHAGSSLKTDGAHYMLVYGQDGPVEAKTALTYRFDGHIDPPDATPAHPDAALMERVRTVLGGLINHAEINECPHEDTHRGGTIWTICDGCGQKWADDEGGFVPYVEPTVITEARRLLSDLKAEAGR